MTVCLRRSTFTTFAVTVVTSATAPAGNSPGLARSASSATVTPGAASPGFRSCKATDS